MLPFVTFFRRTAICFRALAMAFWIPTFTNNRGPTVMAVFSLTLARIAAWAAFRTAVPNCGAVLRDHVCLFEIERGECIDRPTRSKRVEKGLKNHIATLS